MQKNAEKKRAAKKPKRLSKAAEWWIKHPEGIGMVIHDMRAVLR